jgi:YaaC-like Protein
MLVRYEPENWARMARIDASRDANVIEHLLDEALDVVPSIILRAVEDLIV